MTNAEELIIRNMDSDDSDTRLARMLQAAMEALKKNADRFYGLHADSVANDALNEIERIADE
jgi:hypothetical protein